METLNIMGCKIDDHFYEQEEFGINQLEVGLMPFYEITPLIRIGFRIDGDAVIKGQNRTVVGETAICGKTLGDCVTYIIDDAVNYLKEWCEELETSLQNCVSESQRIKMTEPDKEDFDLQDVLKYLKPLHNAVGITTYSIDKRNHVMTIDYKNEYTTALEYEANSLYEMVNFLIKTYTCYYSEMIENIETSLLAIKKLQNKG